jgi:hypothetical protein
MPANPKERNFWQLLAKHRDKIPQETYDYVFYIVSAAVIGENPRLFGFDFDNPLASPESSSLQRPFPERTLPMDQRPTIDRLRASFSEYGELSAGNSAALLDAPLAFAPSHRLR